MGVCSCTMIITKRHHIIIQGNTPYLLQYIDLRTSDTFTLGLFPCGTTAPSGSGPFNVGALRSHSDTPQSVGLLWTNDQPEVETYTWRHTSLIKGSHATGGIRTRNPSKQATADPRLRLHGYCTRPLMRIMMGSPSLHGCNHFTIFANRKSSLQSTMCPNGRHPERRTRFEICSYTVVRFPQLRRKDGDECRSSECTSVRAK